jgi:hypothetical protein
MDIRQTPEADALVTKLRNAKQAKKKLDETKRAKKYELEAMAAKVLETYQASINRLLQAFGANFAIVNARPSFPGGKASSMYQLELNNTTLDIGDSRTPRGKPCFRTALSTGDKSTLALAFFLARLEQHDLSGWCVIIDDPLSSFDSFRIACTQQEIASIATRAAQTVVLSHDPFFLKGILESADRTTTACLQVVRDAASYVLRPWDVADYFLREGHQEYFLLRSYLADGPPEKRGPHEHCPRNQALPRGAPSKSVSGRVQSGRMALGLRGEGTPSGARLSTRGTAAETGRARGAQWILEGRPPRLYDSPTPAN